MKQFILILGVAFSLQAFSQTKCDMQSHYGDFIKIKKGGYDNKEYLFPEAVRVDTQYCFADYVNNNLRHIGYFIDVFCSSRKHLNDLLKIEDSLALQSAFNTLLQEDSVFNAVMFELTAKVIDKTIPKDTITINDLLNITIKLFYVHNITEEGYYQSKICGGINGFAETEQERNPFLETFAWVSISKYYYSGKEYDMYEEFANVMRDLYEINLGIDKEKRLLRARGAVYMQMFYNQKLRDMLLYEYEQKKEYLPFVLRDINQQQITE
jgi:hypothetical protein